MPQAAFDTHAEVGKLKRAGWPEGQAEAMVDLVSRTPLNPQLAQDMEWLKVHVQSNDTRLQGVEARLDGVETRLEGVETRLEGVETRLEGVETRLDGVETRLQRIETRVLRIEDAMPGLATKVDLEILRGETNTRIEALRSEILRAFWIQGLALASLIIGLAGMMLSQAA